MHGLDERRDASHVAKNKQGRTIMRSMLALVVLGLVGCAHTGDVVERTPVTGPLSSYGTLQVTVMPSDPGAVNASKNADYLRVALVNKLKEAKIFNDVTGPEAQGQLNLKVTMLAADGGSALKAMTSGSDAKVSLAVDLQQAADGKSLGQFDVSGNSSSNTRVSVGGVNTDAMSDQTPKALDAAVDQIVQYLSKKK
jgi:hypothetical protein